MSEIPKQPKKSAGDVAYGIAKAAAGVVHPAAGAAAELVGMLFGPPIEKRREKWLNELADAVREVQKQVANPESNEEWVTVALRATEIAMRTHQQEKIAALKNAVINSALSNNLGETIHQILLNYIEVLTPWHLTILHYCNDPEKWRQQHGLPHANITFGSAATMLESSIPELSGRRPFYDLLISDLSQRGLLTSGDWSHTTMSLQGIVASRTTDLGREFLAFISR
jgi:hypothetical protein